MKNTPVAPELHKLLLEGAVSELKELFEDAHPADIAEAVAMMEVEDQWRALSRFEPHHGQPGRHHYRTRPGA